MRLPVQINRIRTVRYRDRYHRRFTADTYFYYVRDYGVHMYFLVVVKNGGFAIDERDREMGSGYKMRNAEEIMG